MRSRLAPRASPADEPRAFADSANVKVAALGVARAHAGEDPTGAVAVATGAGFSRPAEQAPHCPSQAGDARQRRQASDDHHHRISHEPLHLLILSLSPPGLYRVPGWARSDPSDGPAGSSRFDRNAVKCSGDRARDAQSSERTRPVAIKFGRGKSVGASIDDQDFGECIFVRVERKREFTGRAAARSAATSANHLGHFHGDFIADSDDGRRGEFCCRLRLA